jgi:hypothetical protein
VNSYKVEIIDRQHCIEILKVFFVCINKRSDISTVVEEQSW